MISEKQFNFKKIYFWKFLYIFPVLILFVLAPQTLLAQELKLSERQNEIMQIVLSVEGYINEDLHSEFWLEVPYKIRTNPEFITSIKSVVEKGLGAGLVWQREIWESLRLTLKSRRIIKTPNFEKAKKNMLAASNLPTYQEGARNGILQADKMLKAAANSTPVYSTRGTFYVTEELVTQVLNGLEASLERMKILGNPVWGPKLKEYIYQDVHVKILSTEPFIKEENTIELENGQKLRVITRTNLIDDSRLKGVSFTKLNFRWADPNGAVIRTAKSTLEGVGASNPIVAGELWRGEKSAYGTSSINTGYEIVFFSVRVIELPGIPGILTFMTLAPAKIEADLLREELEKATVLLP